MPIDTSIYGMVRGPAQQPGPLDEYAKAMTLRSMIDQQGLHALQRRKLEQEFADDEATRAAYTQGGGDPVRVRDILARQGLYRPAQAIEKTINDRREKDATIGKTEMETFVKGMGLLKDRLPTVRDEASYQEYRQAAASILGPQAFQRANLPPSYSPDWVQRQLVEAKQLFTPKPQEMDLGGRRVVVDMNPFTNPSIVGQSFQKSVTPDAALQAGVTVRGQDQPTFDSSSGQFLTKPGAGAPIPAVGGGAAIPVAPQAAPSPVPGANASYKGANPLKATTAAIAKIKAEMEQTRDPALRASLQREIDGAAQALRMTPEQVAAIQPATAQPSAYDTENNDARDLRLANMPNGGRAAAPPAAPGGSVAIRPVDANGKPIEKRENPPQGYRWTADGKSLEIIPGGPAEKMGEAQVKQAVGVRNTRDAITEYRNALKNWSTTDIASPNARARMGTVYNNMMLQAKEAFNLGVLNGPDMEILQSVITDPASMKGGLVTKAALDDQAKKLDEIMERIGKTVSNQSHQQGASQPTVSETRVKSLPDPAKHKGYEAEDPVSKVKYRSDGKAWVKVNG